MKYKAIVTDLDGSAVTLSSKGDDIAISTIESVQASIQKGYLIACATGRGWVYAKSVVRKLGLTHPCIVEGGTRIINPLTEETLWQRSMRDDDADYVKACFIKYAPQALFVTSDRDKVDEGTDISLGLSQQDMFEKVSESEDKLQSVRYLYLLGIDAGTAANIVNEINTHTTARAHTTASWQGDELVDVHVTDRKATKEHAIQEWLLLNNVSKDETIGFGDSGNDIPIFEAVGLRVAARTGAQAVINLADYIAPGPSEGGLEHIIDTFLK